VFGLGRCPSTVGHFLLALGMRDLEGCEIVE
jgi:hypothetical protein